MSSRSDNSLFPWKEKIQTNKVGLYFTGHGNFSPELFMSKDTADKSLQLDQANSQKQKSNMDLVNNMVNLGFRLTQRFSVGLKAFSPKYSFKEKYATTYSDGKTVNFSADTKSSILGIGGGITYQLKPNIYFGAYYIDIKEKTSAQINFTDITGAVSSSPQDSTFSRKQYGLGLCYLIRGGRGNGTRAEIGVSKMIHPKDSLMKDGEEVYTAVEYSHHLFTFGLNAKFRKNVYYENIELLDSIMGEKNFSDTFNPSYGAFFSLGSGRGHSIGISGLAYQSNGKKQLFNQEQNAKTTLQEITLNYAYLF